MNTRGPLVLPLDSEQASVALFSGKGIPLRGSLARLTREGLPVPSGFVVTTSVYRSFVETSQSTVREESETGSLFGQVIRLDGSRGEATLLDKTAAGSGQLPEPTAGGGESPSHLV